MTADEEKALIERLGKLEGQVTGAETLLQQHKTEMGQARKEIKEALGDTSNLAKREELQKALDKLKELEDNFGRNTASGNQGKGGDGTLKTLEELQGGLISSAKANPVVDEAWKKLSPEERQAVWTNKENLDQFIQAASEVPKPVPGSLLEAGQTGSGQVDQTKERFRKIFKEVAGGSSHVPAGNRTGASGFAGAAGSVQQQEQTSRRLPGGVIPRPSAT